MNYLFSENLFISCNCTFSPALDPADFKDYATLLISEGYLSLPSADMDLKVGCYRTGSGNSE